MSVKVAINGFGRIGRLAFRQMFGAEGYEVVAINDLTDPKMLANLLKYDTAQKGYCGTIGENLHTVEAGENSIIVDGKEITIYAKANAAELPWGELGIRSLSPLPQARIFPPLYSALTKAFSPLRIPSSPLLPAPPTASLPWLTP